MIPVETARQIIRQHSSPPAPATLPLAEAAGLALAADAFSSIDMPPFEQSAMDGYALRFADLAQHTELRVVGEVPAGAAPRTPLRAGEAMRIFTGAPLPPGADTVVMQEKTACEGDRLRIEDAQAKAGDNVRPQGSQTRQGELALPAGSVLSAGALGFLATLGIDKVQVLPRPRIGLIITGQELAPPGAPLQPGQVYESNSIALSGALHALHLQPALVQTVGDDPAQTQAAIRNALERCDMLLLTGGISVGDYDYVRGALEACGVEELFYKVKQRPGKPLWFGRQGAKTVFALPGNPASVLSCFYEYVGPAIRQRMALPEQRLLSLPLNTGYEKKAALSFFLKGRIEYGGVTPLHAQESYRMNSYAEANCLIHLAEERNTFGAGEIVPVRPIPLF